MYLSSSRKCLLGIVAGLTLTGAACAQGGYGRIVGTVSDPTGAVIPGATVKLVQHATGTVREVKANSQGYFTAPGLEPSVYDVTITAAGFAPVAMPGLTLLADQSLTADGHMGLAEASNTVNVESSSVAQVDTTTSTLSQVIEQKRIVDLPLNGRNAAQLATLVPGAVQAPANNADQGQYKTLPAAITVSANGSRANQTAFNLDGSSNNDIYTNVNQPFPFPDALQEFSVQTSNYTARYGGNAGAVVNAITKGGTNQIHGDAFEFLRNAIFNAKNAFATTRDQLKRNQFGGVLGGPIWRDRTFFFVGYQQTEIRNTQNGLVAYVPTPAELNGDFSAISTQLYKPGTSTPYAGNQIPVTDFDPAALKFAKNYLPTSTAAGGQISYGLPLSQSFKEYVVRGDQVFSEKDHLFARYYLDTYVNHPFLNPSNYIATVSSAQINSHNAIVGETHLFTSNLLNDARLSFSRVSTNSGPPANSISVADLGVNVYQPGQFAKALDGISVSGYFSTSSFPPSIMVRNNYTFTDDLSWTHGRHTFAFGGVIARGQVLLRDAYLYGGSFGFTSDNTAYPSGSKTGNALASFLLGSIRTFQQGAGEFKDDRDYFTTLYAQDDFHAMRNLTLNLGIRWEPFIPWYETKGRVEQFRVQNYFAGIHSTQFPLAPAGLLFPGDAGMPANGVTPSYRNFSPRVGFAWDVFGNGTTSLRGGGGIFHDSQQVGIENNRFVDVSPFSLQVAVTTPQGTFSNPYLNMTNPFPASAVPSANTVFPSPTLVVTYDPRDNSRMVAPVTYNYNLTLDQQLPRQTLFRLAYVGTQLRHQTETVELNPAVYVPAGTPTPAWMPTPAAGKSLTTDQRRIFQGYGSIGQGTQDLNGNYNSLQATLQHREKALTLLANYTWSKSLDDVPNGQGNAGIASQSVSTQPAWNTSALLTSSSVQQGLSWNTQRHRFDYGRSDYDRRHIITVSYVYDLPLLAHQNLLIREALGGWQTTGILRYQSGQALTALAGSDVSQSGLGTDRAQQISPFVYGGNACGSVRPCVSYLNPAAFGSVPVGTSGNVRKGAYNGPAYLDWDAGVLKNFALTSSERVRLQFHAEFFNVLNAVNLGNPNMTSNNGAFGTIKGANDPRIGQLALKLLF